MSPEVSWLPADVFAEASRHRLDLEAFLHDDFGHQRCSCSGQRVSAPPRMTGLPDGGTCFACGGMTVRTGTCTTCTSCGETGGCG